MRKFAELSYPNSCMSKARPGEMTFVLLARDVTAPTVIRFWANERIRLGKNTTNDEQIKEALACADLMERERATPELEPFALLKAAAETGDLEEM